MPVSIRDGGVWKEAQPWVHDGGIWKPVKAAWVRDAGVWKQTYASGFDPATPIGTFIEGGYFAGIIVDNGVQNAILVAPKASGENAAIKWKDANTLGPIETRTLTNGPASTAAMVAAGSAATYPAAHWANDLIINGFDDWYLPARDELELIWRNLKPVGGAGNDTSTRLKSSIVYNRDGNTDDESSDTQGINRHSVPTGVAYTTDDPDQTDVLIFRSGGLEAMEFGSAIYWSSSEFATTQACAHIYASFSPGAQSRYGKSNNLQARAVRRVPIA